MNNIDQLLEKYWNAETSLQEESEIRTYFSSDNVAPEHETFRPLFDFFEEKIAEGIDLDVADLINGLESGSAKSDNSPKQKEGAKILNLRKWVTAIAAIFVLGFAAYNIMEITPNQTEYKYKGKFVTLDQEKDAEEALEITKQALAFLSHNVNKGTKTTVKSVSKAKKVKIFK